MTVLAVDIERPAILVCDLRFDSLDDLIVSAWATLRSGRSAACPVCHGPIAPGASARCGDCGSVLS
jgi:hypothetical protein